MILNIQINNVPVVTESAINDRWMRTRYRALFGLNSDYRLFSINVQ